MLYFTWSIVAEDVGEHDATFLYCAHMNAREMESNRSIIFTYTHIRNHTYIMYQSTFEMTKKVWVHLSAFSCQPFRLAVAPVDEAGDEETKQLLEGDESLLGPQLIPKHSFTKDGWKVCGCFSTYSDYITCDYITCDYILVGFLFADVFASWGWVKID